MGNVPVINDAEDAGKTSADANNLGPIKAGTRGPTRPLAADQVPTAPTSGARGRKRPRIATKRSNQDHCAT
jgi:hypothetical protein